MRGDKFWKVRLSLCSSLLSLFVRVKNIPFRPVWPSPATRELLSLWSTRAPSILNSYASYFGTQTVPQTFLKQTHRPMRSLFRLSQPMRRDYMLCVSVSGCCCQVSPRILHFSFLISRARLCLARLHTRLARLTHLFKIVRADKFLSQVSSL